MARPFRTHEVASVVADLNDVLFVVRGRALGAAGRWPCRSTSVACVQLHWQRAELAASDERVMRQRVALTRLFKQLRDRQSRRAFCDPSFFLMPRVAVEPEAPAAHQRRLLALIDEIPFVLSFQDRVRLL